MRSRLFSVLVLWWIAGCSTAPSREYLLGEILHEYTFDQPFGWQQYDAPQVRMQIEDGVYRADVAGDMYVWAMNNEAHTDVMIEADVNLNSAFNINGYGLMCRADPSNDGDSYYFFISGDGAYSIRYGAGGRGTVDAIVPWARTDAIRQGQTRNHIRIVCIDDYLALYINGEFVDAARHDEYQRGFAGVALVGRAGEPVSVEFDNYVVREAALAE